MKHLKVLVLVLSILNINLFAGNLYEQNTQEIQSRDTIITPDNLSVVGVQRFDDTANISIWKDKESSKIYIKVQSITNKIFIANNTHSIVQFDADNGNISYSVNLVNPEDSKPYFDYVYTEVPQILEVVIENDENFDYDKSFSFLFENKDKVFLIQIKNNIQCINVEMDKGWSLVSIPVNITLDRNSNDINTSFDKLGKHDITWTYDNEKNWTRNPEMIFPGQGFWIHKQEVSTIEFCGQPYSPILKELKKGWNLVGSGELLYNIDKISYIDISWKYKQGQWTHDFDSVVAGEGFWLKIGEPDKIMIPAVPINMEDNSTVVDDSLQFNTQSRSLSIVPIDEYTFKVLNANLNDYIQHKGEPFFILKHFKGMIKDVEQSGTDVIIYTEDAKDISKVYKKIQFKFDGVTQSSSRTLIKDRKIYTYKNKDPIILSMTSKNRSLTSEGIFTKLTIPGTYQFIKKTKLVQNRAKIYLPIPIEFTVAIERKLGDNGAVEAAIGVSFYNDTKPTSFEYSFNPKVSFEYGIWDPYIKYDIELKEENKQNIYLEISGAISGSISKDLIEELAGGLEWYIPIPSPIGVTVSIEITPSLELGLKGELVGKYNYSYENSSSKTVYLNYNSKKDVKSKEPIFDNPAAKSSHSFSAELSTVLSLNAALTTAPVVGIPYTSINIGLFSCSAGAELACSVAGKLATHESGTVDNKHFEKNYNMHEFFPYYVETAITLEPYVSANLDIDIADTWTYKQELLKFTPIKVNLARMDFGVMPEPKICELPNLEIDKKSFKLEFPESANDYLGKFDVKYGSKIIDFDASRSTIIYDVDKLDENEYIFTSSWKNDSKTYSPENLNVSEAVLSLLDLNKISTPFVLENSLIIANDVVFKSNGEECSDDTNGTWYLELKCEDEEIVLSTFKLDLVKEDSSFDIFSIHAEASSEDYNGETIKHEIQGTMDIHNLAQIKLYSTFQLDENITRIDSFSVSLTNNDTGYVKTQQSWKPNGTGCNAKVRFLKRINE